MIDLSFNPIWIFAFVGVVVSWAKVKVQQRNIYGLSQIVGMFILSEKKKALVEIGIFVTIGCLVSIGVIKPVTEAQALAAGLAWTGVMSTR